MMHSNVSRMRTTQIYGNWFLRPIDANKERKRNYHSDDGPMLEDEKSDSNVDDEGYAC